MAKNDYPTDHPAEPSQSAPVGGDQVSALLLCGGAGRRMGGADKGLLTLGGEPAVRRGAGLLHALCDAVFISANRNLASYRALGIGRVIPDLRTGFPGPLAALEAVALQLETPFLLLLPCDLPLLERDVPMALLAELQAQDAVDVVYAQSVDAPGGEAQAQKHYLCAALRRESLAGIGAFMDNGGRAVHHWYATLRSRPLSFTGSLAAGFFNVNSEADLLIAREARHSCPEPEPQP